MSGYRKYYLHFDGSPGEKVFGLTLTACFVLVMSYYGISSFLKARKISRS